MGRCQSGRMSTIGNRVYVKSVPRVRIPPCPLREAEGPHGITPVGPLVFGEICLRARAQGSPPRLHFLCTKMHRAGYVSKRQAHPRNSSYGNFPVQSVSPAFPPNKRKEPAPRGESGGAGSESSGGSKPEPCEESRVTSGGRPHRRAPQAAPCSWRRSSRERRHRSADPPRWCGSHQRSCGSAWSR